jgi:hypothetical protein
MLQDPYSDNTKLSENEPENQVCYTFSMDRDDRVMFAVERYFKILEEELIMKNVCAIESC